VEHRLHAAAREFAASHAPDGLALAPQVIARFTHVVTNPRRFEMPLSVSEALGRSLPGLLEPAAKGFRVARQRKRFVQAGDGLFKHAPALAVTAARAVVGSLRLWNVRGGALYEVMQAVLRQVCAQVPGVRACGKVGLEKLRAG